MQKVIGYGLLIAYLLFMGATLAHAAVINATGSSGVCVAVATTGVTTVANFNALRTNLTLYCTTQMNCEPGPATGGAPAVTPTTGAIGTGAGFPVPATTLFSIGDSRALLAGQVGAGGATLNMEPASRVDCIAGTANGNCCTWEQF